MSIEKCMVARAYVQILNAYHCSMQRAGRRIGPFNEMRNVDKIIITIEWCVCVSVREAWHLPVCLQPTVSILSIQPVRSVFAYVYYGFFVHTQRDRWLHILRILEPVSDGRTPMEFVMVSNGWYLNAK